MYCRVDLGIKLDISIGDAGYRSPYFSHAKRALYHLSYTPADLVQTQTQSREQPSHKQQNKCESNRNFNGIF